MPDRAFELDVFCDLLEKARSMRPLRPNIATGREKLAIQTGA
jgi:hypothetical protein